LHHRDLHVKNVLFSILLFIVVFKVYSFDYN